MRKLIKVGKEVPYVDLTVLFEGEDGEAAGDDDEGLAGPPVRYYLRG